jgi:hypothetical protein
VYSCHLTYQLKYVDCDYADLWRERNARSFEDRELGLMDLKKRVMQTLFSWRVLWNPLQVTTLVEFLEFCASFSN